MLDKLLSRTKREGDCMIWTGSLTTCNYPRATIGGNPNTRVTRAVFELCNGYRPVVVRHSCDNTLCINPDHLVGGSPTDNMRDRHERRRTHGQVFQEEIEEVLELRALGNTYLEISKQLGIKIKRVEYIVTRKGG